MDDPYPFALCLTHDVDRPYKTYQSWYYALRERSPYHLRTALTSENPYWRFERLMAIEEELGVRSAFYVLNEPHILTKPPRALSDPTRWLEHLGRYDPTSLEMAAAIRSLDRGGWEIGLHASYDSAGSESRLREEKRVVEGVVGHEVRGVRHHHLRIEGRETWEKHARIGLRYDTSLGSASSYGYEHGYRPLRPFGDEFLVFPLTLMEVALPDVAAAPERAWSVCERLLAEARENRAVCTVLWHPRYFDEREFPGFTELYRRLVDRALAMGAWVGPPGELHGRLVDGPIADC
ncbi:polysaccharide deacetylase family protein [Natronorarus salvus]|uniref:polysaccharide deacetylase family protein n=1 Tax=Natronorarus salvus TaxID=3117733 RepID=UPI002F26C678